MELLNLDWVKLTKRQRENIAKALFDISKLIVGILVLGSAVSPQGFRVRQFISGCIAFFVVFVWATVVDKGE